MGRHQEGLLVAVNTGGWGRVAADKDIWRRTFKKGQGPMRAVWPWRREGGGGRRRKRRKKKQIF